MTVCRSFIEVSAHSPLARAKCVSPSELKDIPCILVACEAQRKTEREYYHDVVGFPGEFLYAENLEEARLMVIGHKGFLPVEGADVPTAEPSVVRIPLKRADTQKLLRLLEKGQLGLLCGRNCPAAQSAV